MKNPCSIIPLHGIFHSIQFFSNKSYVFPVHFFPFFTGPLPYITWFAYSYLFFIHLNRLDFNITHLLKSNNNIHKNLSILAPKPKRFLGTYWLLLVLLLAFSNQKRYFILFYGFTFDSWMYNTSLIFTITQEAKESWRKA